MIARRLLTASCDETARRTFVPLEDEPRGAERLRVVRHPARWAALVAITPARAEDRR